MNSSNSVLQIPIEDIIPNRFQPRLSFDEASLKELADSIKQHGIIQPLVLRRIADKYEIIAGERRYKAAMMAGLASVPAVITDMDDNTSAEVAIVENVQRKDLTAIEEARSYKALLDKGYMTQEELAKKMGLSQAAISNKLRLLSLDESVQDAVLNNQISERHARSLLKIKDLNEQKNMLSKIINERLTVRQLEEEIKKMNIEEPNESGSENIMENQSEALTSTPSITPEVSTPKIEVPNAPATPMPNPTPVPPKKTFGNIFSNPDQIPNKFFNFLEDEAVNMSMEEPIPTSTPVTASNEEEIELLDFSTPEATTTEANVKPDYINNIVNQVRALNFDSNKVAISETDGPFEYVINIKIKKDNVNN